MSAAAPRVGVSWMRGPAFAAAVEPVRGQVEAVEWTLEHGFRPPPPDVEEALTEAEERGALYGHAVHGSMLSAAWTPLDDDWLRRVRAAARARRFTWVSEHFGWLRAGSWHAAPLPLPFGRRALQLGQARLQRLSDALQVPVGLENLALAWSRDDALAQPDFVDALLRPVDGLVVLDLHNLWCQAVNYGLDPVALLERWPLSRVRGLHVSGGSWAAPGGRPFRRDTHDGAVPDEVWALLPEALGRCPAVEVVVLERLPDGLDAPGAAAAWRGDLLRLGEAVRVERTGAPPREERAPATPGRDDPERLQPALLDGLASDLPLDDLVDRLITEVPSAEAWLRSADPRALQTARELVARWGRRVPVR